MSSHQQSTDPGVEQPLGDADALEQAATVALRAPSIFNTQPWRWRIHDGVAELRADRDRQLRVVDPQGRMLTMSCGVALHHFRTALAATGHQAEVVQLPERGDPDLLARVRITATGKPQLGDIRRYESLLIRHTDRRPFERTPVPPSALADLRSAVEASGAHLHVVRPDQLPALIVAADRAAAEETANPAYRAEVAAWTHRPTEAGDGVPDTTVVPDVPRRIPLRDFSMSGAGRLAAGSDDDSGATYAVVFVGSDNPLSWLQSGEALGAALIAAVEHGLSVSPMSDLVEVADVRQTLRRILSGIGEPMLVLRIGLAEPLTGVPQTPRRDPNDVIERDPEPGYGGES
jgi:hypothetical protein